MKSKGNLYHNTQIIFAYNTNHIKVGKLTEDQTRYTYETNNLLTEKESITNLDDIIETANHFKLVDYMLDVADKYITEEMIKKFHKILRKEHQIVEKTGLQLENIKSYQMKLENQILQHLKMWKEI